MLNQLFRQLFRGKTGSREVTPTDVRDLIDRGQIEGAWEGVGRLAQGTTQRAVVQACLRGEIEFRRHRDAEAEVLFREALKEVPGLPDAHYGLSLVMLARGETGIALRHATFAANNSQDPRMSAQLGLCHIEMKDYIRAGKSLARATRLDPNDKSSWNNLGITRRALGDAEGARMAFARALELDANFEKARANADLLEAELAQMQAAGGSGPAPDGLDDRSEVALSLAEIGVAIDQCEQRYLEHSDEASHVVELARLYRLQGDARSGADALEAFLARHPDDLDAVSALGRACVDLREFGRGIPLVERALAARPDDVDLLLSMADIRFAQERLADSGALIERAFELQPSFHMRGRLAASLGARCRYEEALELIAGMVAERPSAARDTLGIKMDALIALGRHDEALPELDALIEHNPNDPNHRFLRASINLLRENFAQGWDDYAFRNLQTTRHLRMLPFALWNGEPLEGKTILVAAEQGLGDQVMFASCLPDLIAKGPKRVIVEVKDRVAPTLARSFPECEVISTNQDSQLDWVRDLGQVDYFTLIADLPGRFRRSRSDFPAHRGYFRADPERVSFWRRRLGDLDGGARPRIGVTWRGGIELTRTVLRSMKVTDLSPLLSAVDATWVNLQYGDVSADLSLAGDKGMQFAYWPEAIKDLDEFAALVSALDLVITVCNTTVHYAGALGKDVWVMTPKVPEWRYGLHFDRMPWYPSSRLFRQTTAGDWASVHNRVCAELRAWTQDRSHPGAYAKSPD